MLDNKEIQKYVRPLLFNLTLKHLAFLGMLIFCISKNVIGFNEDNNSVSQCNDYFNYKLSNYADKIKSVQFFMSLIGFVLSGLNLFLILPSFLAIKSYKYFRNSNWETLTENRLRMHFILNFVQFIGTINIFSRAIQGIIQTQSCGKSFGSSHIGLVVFALVIFIILLITTGLLFKYLSIIIKKQRNSEQMKLFTQRDSIRQNLFFNKQGYINELRKLQNQNYSSKSTVLKEKTIKNAPSGFKAGQYITTRQILHRLRGGKKVHKKTIQQVVEQQYSVQFQKESNKEENFSNQNIQDLNQKAKYLKDTFNISPKTQNNDKLLAVEDHNFDSDPNQQNYQRVGLTSSIMNISINGSSKQMIKPQKGTHINSKHQTPNEPYAINNGLIKLKKVPDYDKKNGYDQGLGYDNFKKLSPQQQEQLELKTNYNLCPNIKIQPQKDDKRNTQNLDVNGKYLFVDAEYIRRKSKYLSDMYDQKTKGMDPNLLYMKKKWNPRQRRLQKPHQRNIQQTLRRWQRIKKEQILCDHETSSEQTDSEEDAQFSSEIDDSITQELSQAKVVFQSDTKEQVKEAKKFQMQEIIKQPQIKNLIQPSKLTEAQIEAIKNERDRRSAYRLFLHMKRWKQTGAHYKNKLYQDQQGFYDQEGEFQNQNVDNTYLQQGEIFQQACLQNGDRKNQKQQTLERQKNKIEDKPYLKNRELQTDEAGMLRFIRSKYIEPQLQKQRIRQQNEQLEQHNQIIQEEEQKDDQHNI